MKIIVSFLLAIISYSLCAQLGCFIESPRANGNIPDAVNYIPNENTVTKFFRVNVHFILREIGTPGYPGNFTSYDDGNGNLNYNGYDYAYDLINMANYRLSNNAQMHMPPNNSTPILERKYRYVLNAVFFHEDNNNYNQPLTAPLYLSKNIGEVVNIFIKPGLNYSVSGYAYMTSNRYCVILNAWEGYLVDPITQLWIKAQTLNHEIGHNLSLFHTMLTPSGNICTDIEDYCSDTPTRSSIIQNYGFDPCCGWGGDKIVLIT